MDLATYVQGQVTSMFPDRQPLKVDDIQAVLPQVMARLEHCFQAVDSKYFFDGHQTIFSHLHGDQYAIFLYMLSNELFRQGAPADLCSKVFLLNKALHGCDIFYEVELPSIFLVVHPLGTVLGRGQYSDYFVAYQRCGVGSNHDIYPKFGQHVTLRPGAAVLGASSIGDHCHIAAETLIIDQDIKDNTLVMGPPGVRRIKPNPAPYPLWRN
jgi:serine O-acetyltransferase